MLPTTMLIGEPVQELERIHVGMGQAWPGLSQEHLGDWILRFGGGYTSRANSALPVGKPGAPIAEAIKHVKDSYASRGLSPKYQIPLLTHAEIPQRIPVQAERADSFVPGSTIDTGATPVNKELDDVSSTQTTLGQFQHSSRRFRHT